MPICNGPISRYIVSIGLLSQNEQYVSYDDPSERDEIALDREPLCYFAMQSFNVRSIRIKSKYVCYVLIEVEIFNLTVPVPLMYTSHNVRIFISPGILIVNSRPVALRSQRNIAVSPVCIEFVWLLPHCFFFW